MTTSLIPDSNIDRNELLHTVRTPSVIEPPVGWQFINVRELWQARELVFFLAWRDVKVRYKQTILGAAWAVFQPLMMMVVFSIFFGRMAGVSFGGVPYPLFVLTGLLPWTFFATVVATAGNSVIGSEPHHPRPGSRGISTCFMFMPYSTSEQRPDH